MPGKPKDEPKWDYEAGVRLVQAVQEANGPIPARLLHPGDDAGRERLLAWNAVMSDLAHEVSIAFSMSEAWPDVADESRANRRAENLAKIKGQVTRLRKQLETLEMGNQKDGTARDAMLIGRINQALPSDFPDALEFMKALLEAVTYVDKEMAGRAPVPGLTGTAQGHLIQLLANCYISYFEASPRTDLRKTYKHYSGPFPAFVQAAYKIAGRPYTSDSLTKALERHLPV